MIYHNKCDFCHIKSINEVQSAIKLVDSLIKQAVVFSDTHWDNKGYNQNKQELSRFQIELSELERLLTEASKIFDCKLQDQIETQIYTFKNEVDESQAIQQYLIQSKYTQLEYIGYGNENESSYVEQLIN